jgi:hypothetical protein
MPSNLGRAPRARHQHEPVGLVEVSSVAAGEEGFRAELAASAVVMVASLGSGSRRGEPLGAGRGAGILLRGMR